MKGWVYVISNKSMPGLVKIGFTMKDPEIRASDLNGTGVPTPYVVDYEVLVEEPRDVERTVHTHLAQHREGKEWFRLSAENAIAGIKHVTKNSASFENYKTADRLKAETIAQANQLKAEQKQADRILIEQKIRVLEDERKKAVEIRNRELLSAIPDVSFWTTYAYVIFVIACLLFVLIPTGGDGLWFMAGMLAFIVTPFVIGWLRDENKNKTEYKKLEKQHDDAIANIDRRIDMVKNKDKFSDANGRNLIKTNIRRSG